MLDLGKIGDEQELSEIHIQAFPDGWNAQQMQKNLSAPHNYVIKQSSTGFVLFQVLGDECEILTIAIVPEMQGKMLGSALLTEMLAMCEQMQVRKVFLEVSVSNKKAQNLYEKFAFTEYNRRKNYYADGSDAVLLQRTLQD